MKIPGQRSPTGLLRITIAVVFLTAAVALGLQAVIHPARTRAASMASMLPQGALLTVESPNFAALLHTWNNSPQQKAWLASDNYSVFSNSRLFSRLADAQTEFESAAQVRAQAKAPDFGSSFLTEVAGGPSIFAWYDVGNLEFLYITRMPSAQAARISLLQPHTGWSPRQSGGTTFYIRHSPAGSQGMPRTVAYAHIPSPASDLVLLATREDLIANALVLIHAPGAALSSEPWYVDASASLQPSSSPSALHMALNLDRLVPLPAFRTYWVQRNITQMKQYRAAVSDLYLERAQFREERAILLKTAGDNAATPVLESLAAMAPTNSGVFRVTATHDPAIAVSALEEKLLGRITLQKLPDRDAPDPSLVAPQSGSSMDLETRIDAPAPISESFSNQALTSALQTAGLDAVLTYSIALPPSTPSGLWVPIHSAVVVHSTSPWNPQTLQSAFQQSLRGNLTASSLGIDFHALTGTSTIYALNGPKPFFFAVRSDSTGGNLAIFSDDLPLLQTLIARPINPSTAAPSDLIAGFDHTGQRQPYARFTALIDGSNKPQAQTVPGESQEPASPNYFSANLRSLSDSFAALSSERFSERPVDLPAGPALRQTVIYQWRAQ